MPEFILLNLKNVNTLNITLPSPSTGFISVILQSLQLYNTFIVLNVN